ncbi:MAG: hypothetical protein GY923_12000 [Aestuariibacter sp.]|uniref:hypothetical protein n=1 Tax=Marisediminitalea aggregata TaxID=634436 RepID=UPI0020CC4AD1|nr:hypothetical protein [Marisediminitalea aggregata]MCP4527032.1 hypothetical protein [Aestuariibacter sp.]MCP4948211.1 hypothetical protein [Aestuariibacter sp.]MCP9476466.1 hypothetical protein [Marisediminitalea aggregata]
MGDSAIELLIPFGISNKTGHIVEPDDAERGRACNCRCPGCDTPLLSRHPKDEAVRMHFAHDSRHPEAIPSVISKCPFNGALAIALMAKHIANNLKGSVILLPELHIRVDYVDCIHEGYVQVASVNELQIDDVEVEVNKFGSTFDLRLVFGKYSIFVWLLYKDRPLPQLSKDQLTALGKTGFLCLDINSFNQKSFASEKRRFSEAVQDFLLHRGDREWVYHPKAEAAANEDRKRHRCNWNSSASSSRRFEGSFGRESTHVTVDTSYSIKQQPIRAPLPTRYQCVMCKTEWIHSVHGAPNCPKGCGHLFSRKLG